DADLPGQLPVHRTRAGHEDALDLPEQRDVTPDVPEVGRLRRARVAHPSSVGAVIVKAVRSENGGQWPRRSASWSGRGPWTRRKRLPSSPTRRRGGRALA